MTDKKKGSNKDNLAEKKGRNEENSQTAIQCEEHQE